MKKNKIFLVHGLFMHGCFMGYMRSRLSECGYQVYSFSYKTTKEIIFNNAKQLVEFAGQHTVPDDICHFVGHSLGGLLIRYAYEQAPAIFTGSIVTIGTPHNGSFIARYVAGEVHRAILGTAFDNALDGNLPPWKGEVKLGSIAGTKGLGIGMALHSLPRPNDGTVSVSETQLTNQTDHIELPLSHTAMLYSSAVVQQVDYFLRHGVFDHRLRNE